MTVLVAVDFSPASRRALDWAVAHALAKDESLLVAHAFAGSRRSPGAEVGHLDPIRQVEAEINVDEALELSENWSGDARDAGVDVETIAERGKPADLILEYAKDRKVSIIVIGTRGHGAIKRAVLGSVAAEVAAKAKCPVVVIPNRASSK